MISQSDRHPSSDRITFHLSSIFRHFQTIHCINLIIFPKKHMKKFIFSTQPQYQSQIEIPNTITTPSHIFENSISASGAFSARAFSGARVRRTLVPTSHTHRRPKNAHLHGHIHTDHRPHTYTCFCSVVCVHDAFSSQRPARFRLGPSRDRAETTRRFYLTLLLLYYVCLCVRGPDGSKCLRAIFWCEVHRTSMS